MKILILQDYLRSGGTERQSILLANAFSAQGHSTTLLTFRPGGPLASTLNQRVRHSALQPFDLGLDWFAPGLLARTRELSPEVILCFGRMANCHGWRLAALAPTVGTMRTGKSLPWLFRRTLRVATHIVANSHDARGTLVKVHQVDPSKISVIYNSLVFPAVTAQRATRAALRARHGATPSTKVLLSVAMFRREKNQRELIEIVAGLSEQLDWQLWLAGDGPDRARCESLVAARQLGSRVRFLGFQRDPSPLYQAADLAVHASWSEALSNFLIEAQAHGLLAVAYEAQGIRECFKPGRTGWAIAPGDRSGFRATLSRRISEPQSAHDERAADASTFARTTFDPGRQTSAYLELLQKLTTRPRS